MKEKIKEYYRIENTSEFESTVKKIVHRFAKLGGLMLNGWAEVYSLWINADGTECEFSGKTVTEVYQKIITAIGSADKIEIVAEFSFELVPETGIFLFTTEIAEHLDDMINKKGIGCLNELFYSLYDFTDEDILEPTSVTHGKSETKNV